MYNVYNIDKTLALDGFSDWYEAVNWINTIEPNSFAMDELGQICNHIECMPVGKIQIFIHDEKTGLDKYIFFIDKMN